MTINLHFARTILGDKRIVFLNGWTQWDVNFSRRRKKMPAVSKKQRIAMAIAEHHPEKLYKRNKAMAKMSKEQLSEFARKSTKGNPEFTDTEMCQGYRKI
jgi:hypothetical protein